MLLQGAVVLVKLFRSNNVGCRNAKTVAETCDNPSSHVVGLCTCHYPRNLGSSTEQNQKIARSAWGSQSLSCVDTHTAGVKIDS
jgi:hypothetical protein